MKKISMVLMILLFGKLCWSATWYVRPSGSTYGSGNGTSFTNAWSGFANIDCNKINPGDKIIFAGTFYGDVDHHWDICQDNLIIEGNNATFVHAKKVNSWDGNDGNVYYNTNFSSTIRMIFEDGIPIKKASDANCTDGNWFHKYSTGTLYYRPTSGTANDHTVRFERYPFGLFRLNGHGGIIFRRLTLKNGEYLIDGNYKYSGNFTGDITIENCTFERCHLCVDFDVSDSSQHITWQNLTLRNNIARFCEVVFHFNTGDGDPANRDKHFQYVNIYNNEFYFGDCVDETCRLSWDEDLYPLGDREILWMHSFLDSNITNNKWYDCNTEGLRMYAVGPQLRNSIAGNEFYRTSKPLVVISNQDVANATHAGVVIHDNYFYDCNNTKFYGDTTISGDIELGNGLQPIDTTPNYFIHNVLNNCTLKLRYGGNNWHVYNNILIAGENTKSANTTIQSFYYPNAPDIMFKSDYNIFCSPRDDMFYSQWTAEFLTLDEWRKLKGKNLDIHSRIYCPSISAHGIALPQDIFKDAGNVTTLSIRKTDKAGHRIIDGKPDIGAYELLSIPIPSETPILF